MTTPSDNLDELLDRVRAGRLDELTPEQVAALEAHLDATPTAAERLANVIPEPDPHLSAPVSSPTEDQWNAIWERVESAASSPRSPRRPVSRVLRFWSPLAAAAACLLLVVVWRLSAPPAWEMHLSEHVVVHELEVFGNSSAFVAYSDDDDGSAMIWVFEEDEDNQGA
jgi:hypothetical protein